MVIVVLYSTGCPRCKVLKAKLEQKGIKYTENNSVDDMMSIGINEVPVLGVDGELLNFTEAVKWINKQEGGVYANTTQTIKRL